MNFFQLKHVLNRLRTRPYYREYHNREKKQRLDNRKFIQEPMTIVLKNYPLSREKKKKKTFSQVIKSD